MGAFADTAGAGADTALIAAARDRRPGRIRTAHNTAIDAVKHRNRFTTPDALELQMEPALRADPERVTLLQEQQDQTWRAAFKLSDNHRAILTLRELHDLSLSGRVQSGKYQFSGRGRWAGCRRGEGRLGGC
ncbi:MAG: RNA polymerase sigma factor [Thermoleophilia bacterium]